MATTSPERRAAQARDWNLPNATPRASGEVVVADGFGISVHVNRGQLVVRDGIGRDRRERRYGRAASDILRLVVLGGSGSLSLEAIRWLRNVGAAMVCIDRDGKPLCASSPAKNDAKLRRAQALAPFTGTGLEITRYLPAAKLRGQQRVLELLDPGPSARRIVDKAVSAVQAATSIEDAVRIEAEAARAYWSSWSDVPVRFRPADRDRVPSHWTSFGQRRSSLSHQTKRAATPSGAVLNYLYALAEAETRLACLAAGLDPALAIVHADVLNRDSLPLDLVEAIRPSVDRYLRAFLRDRVFRASDFYETNRGVCRLLAPFTHELAETLPAWQELITPVVSQVTGLLTTQANTAVVHPLSRPVKSARRPRRTGNPSYNEPLLPQVTRPRKRCKRCGDKLPEPWRVYCDSCLPLYQREQLDQAFGKAGVQALARAREVGADPSHGGQAAARRGATMTRRRRELREWQPDPANPVDPDEFAHEILPSIQGVPLSELMAATGLSLRYVSRIRNGEKVPHPRHWSALRIAADPPRGV